MLKKLTQIYHPTLHFLLLLLNDLLLQYLTVALLIRLKGDDWKSTKILITFKTSYVDFQIRAFNNIRIERS